MFSIEEYRGIKIEKLKELHQYLVEQSMVFPDKSTLKLIARVEQQLEFLRTHEGETG